MWRSSVYGDTRSKISHESPMAEIVTSLASKPYMRDGQRQKWVRAAVFGILLAAWLFGTIAVIVRIAER